MKSNILFHPQLKAIDALRIARAQGCRLVWRSATSVRIVKAMEHSRRANAAIETGDYEAALQHIRAARHQVDGMEGSAA